MSTLAFVDSLAAVTEALEAYSVVRLATDNPLLAFDPRLPARVENIDALFNPQETNDLCHVGVRLAIEMDARLASDNEIAKRLGRSSPIASHSVRMTSSLLYRSALLARAVHRFNPSAVLVYAADAPHHEPGAPALPSRFLAPAMALVELKFFGSIPAQTTTVAVALPTIINETAIKSILRRSVMFPLPVLFFEFWQRIAWTRRTDFDFVLYGQNDAIREVLPYLAVKGIRWLPTKKPPEIKFSDIAQAVEIAESTIDARHSGWLIERILSASRDFDAESAGAVARLMTRYFAAGLAVTATAFEPTRQWMAANFDGVRRCKKVLVTAGMFGPTGAVLHAVAKEQGVTVATFEHGATKGLSALSASRSEASEMRLADVFLGCAPNAASDHREEIEQNRLQFRAIGLPDQTRKLLRRPLQRIMARRALGIACTDGVVMHVSTWPYHGNHRSGPGVPPETSVFEFDRTLLQDAYRNVPHRVFFKPYPTQRFVHEPDYRELFQPAPGVQFVDQQDFRYIRAAADVIVTTNPTSTLGWCVGAGVPLVWLDSRWMTPLATDELRDRFRRSFIVVDIDRADWSQTLRGVVSQDLVAINQLWRSKADERQSLLADAICGPPGSMGRRGAAAIIETLNADHRMT